MKKIAAGLLSVAASALLAGAAHAQIPHITPFAFEARAGVAVPTGSFNDAANPGYALNGNITYNAIPLVGVYAGYDYAHFGQDGGSGKFTDTGVDVGLRVGIPTPLIPIDPYLKGGVVFHRLKLTDAATQNFSDTGTGLEVGAGLGFGFGPLSLTPGVSYVHYNVAGGRASYVKADVGLRVRI
jgi:hypothetical protein